MESRVNAIEAAVAAAVAAAAAGLMYLCRNL